LVITSKLINFESSWAEASFRSLRKENPNNICCVSQLRFLPEATSSSMIECFCFLGWHDQISPSEAGSGSWADYLCLKNICKWRFPAVWQAKKVDLKTCHEVNEKNAKHSNWIWSWLKTFLKCPENSTRVGLLYLQFLNKFQHASCRFLQGCRKSRWVFVRVHILNISFQTLWAYIRNTIFCFSWAPISNWLWQQISKPLNSHSKRLWITARESEGAIPNSYMLHCTSWYIDSLKYEFLLQLASSGIDWTEESMLLAVWACCKS
jgi:hypothetical protein